MRDIAASDCAVSTTRVSDRTRRSSRLPRASGRRSLTSCRSTALRAFLTRRLGSSSTRCRSRSFGYEGSPSHVVRQRRGVGKLVRRHGGVCIGSGPGELYDQKKFDTPYIRDFLLDRGVAGDVSETAMPWSQLLPV